jgi:hypothetical protein
MHFCAMIGAVRELRLYLVLLAPLGAMPTWRARLSVIWKWLRGLPRYRDFVQVLVSRLFWERLFECTPERVQEVGRQAAAALTLYLTARRRGRFLTSGYAGGEESGDPLELLVESVDAADRQAVVDLASRLSHAVQQAADEGWRYIIITAMPLPAQVG